MSQFEGRSHRFVALCMLGMVLFNYPILGKTMRLGSLVPVDRGSREVGIVAVRAAASVLRQGINRQVRRMFEAVGYHVKHLVRVRIGSLRLGDLPRGDWRALTKGELRALEGRAPACHAEALRRRAKPRPAPQELRPPR